jgi:ArsR family transcriptional regulator
MSSTTELVLEEILSIFENPARREIIKRLSQEPNYSFQLAKDTGLSQQQIANHLRVMEEAGIVDSSKKSGAGGPRRLVYRLSKSFSLVLDVAPHMYNEKLVSFDVTPDREVISEDHVGFMDKVDEILEYPRNQDRLEPLAHMIDDIDKEISRREKERLVFLFIRNLVMSEAHREIQVLDSADARRVIYSAIDEHDSTVSGISKTLNLREDFVRETIEKIKRELRTDYL